LINLNAEYRFKAANFSSISNAIIQIRIPTQAELVESTLIIDGKLLTNYTYENNMLTIPVTGMTGSLRFSVQPIENSWFATYAIMQFTQGGNSKREIIGVECSDMPLITVNTDEEFEGSTIKISGVALPEQNVDIYLDDVLQKTVQTLKTGRYSAELTVPSLKNYAFYEIRVESKDASNAQISATTITQNIPAVPVLIDFSMEHNGQSYTLADLEGIRPIVTFRGGVEFNFTADFTHRDLIDKVYLVSTRSNVQKRMEATWDATANCYKASGYFDSDNHSYVPGIISLEYTQHDVGYSVFDVVDFSADEYVNSLPKELASAQVTVHDNTAQKLDVDITFPNAGDITVNLMVEHKSIPTEITVANAEQMGYVRIPAPNEDGAMTLLSESYSDIFVKSTYDFITDRITTSIIDFGKDEISEITTSLDGYLNAYDAFNTTTGWIKTLKGHDKNSNIIESARQTILSDGSGNIHERLEFLDTAQKINNGKLALKLLGTAITLAGIGNPMIGVTMIALGFLYDLQLKKTMLDVDQLSGKKLGVGAFDFRFAIDPSGYVYDITTNQRLQGVTVTVYYKETPTSSPIVWDASEYEQANPLYTDKDGRYAWDVPEGWWQVKAEMEGYQTAYSEWLPVPPPQLDVNIGLVKDGDLSMRGDADCNGTVSTADAALILRYLAGLADIDEQGRKNANVTNSGTISAADAALVLRYLAGLASL